MENQALKDSIIKRVKQIVDERTLYAIYIFISHYASKKDWELFLSPFTYDFINNCFKYFPIVIIEFG